jgi:hypothetical protein
MKTEKISTVKKVSNGARVMDAVLCVAFFVAALNAEKFSGWWWFFVVSSVFCAFTASTAPLEKLNKFIVGRFIKSKSAR